MWKLMVPVIILSVMYNKELIFKCSLKWSYIIVNIIVLTKVIGNIAFTLKKYIYKYENVNF